MLTLSQCCGLDLFRPHTKNVVPFAAPVMTALDVSPGKYFSYIVARPSANLRAPHVVVNDRYSHSGHTAIKDWLEIHNTTNYTISESGSHEQSLISLRDGRADVAAIDALSYLHLDTAELEILGTSEPAPAPPFIMGKESNIPANEMTDALNKAFERYGHRIGIGGVQHVSISHYRKMALSASRHGILPG
jgi:ABC-type phosphate/phosphonate transport system substrate-binding protein